MKIKPRLTIVFESDEVAILLNILMAAYSSGELDNSEETFTVNLAESLGAEFDDGETDNIIDEIIH